MLGNAVAATSSSLVSYAYDVVPRAAPAWYVVVMSPETRPRQVVASWVELFNAADVDGLVALYHDDAVNHQVANLPVSGKAAIREMFSREFAAAKMVCIVEQILEDAPWAILEWKDPIGLRGCGFFLVEDGRIRLQRGYWDKLSFLRAHGLPVE